MCGLIGASSVKNKHTGHHIINLYRKQDSRGKSGFGYLAIDKGVLLGVRRSKEEAGILKMLSTEKADTILFHHRLPTSTKNTLGTTHPIFVSNEELEFDYYFAHNGIITNAKFLKEKHEALGYKYQTEFTEHTVAVYGNGTRETLDEHNTVFNDSESLAIELARYIEGASEKVNTTGAAAFWGISLKKGTNEVQEIFFGKNKGRDLAHFKNHKWAGFASETGNDIEAMKIFSYGPNKPTELFEREFLVDTAEPITRVGFHQRELTSSVTITTPPTNNVGYRFEPNDEMEQEAYDNLINTQYSYYEVEASGLSDDEFFSVGSLEVSPNARVWLPMKFAGNTVGRISAATRQPIAPFVPSPKVLYLEGDTYVDYTPTQTKEEEKLEELVLQFVELEDEITRIERKVTDRVLSDYTSRNLIAACLAKQTKIEEQFAELGIDAEIIDDKLDEARELLDYNDSSYLPEREGVTVI